MLSLRLGSTGLHQRSVPKQVTLREEQEVVVVVKGGVFLPLASTAIRGLFKDDSHWTALIDLTAFPPTPHTYSWDKAAEQVGLVLGGWVCLWGGEQDPACPSAGGLFQGRLSFSRHLAFKNSTPHPALNHRQRQEHMSWQIVYCLFLKQASCQARTKKN